jgi:hypothetical protein
MTASSTGLPPSVANLLNMARDEAIIWTLAGAKGLASLSVRACLGISGMNGNKGY